MNRVIAGITAGCMVIALTACVPEVAATTATTVDVRAVYASNGIATVPFDGGEPVDRVDGETVLALTDWQVQNIQNGMRASGAGVDLAALDAAVAPVVDPVEPGLSPSQFVLAWWSAAESPRAELARAAYPAPDLTAWKTVPVYVLVLFTADSMEDLGRTDASAPAALAGERVYAIGPQLALDGLDACGVLSGAINDVNAFLDSAGVVGSIVRKAAGVAYDVTDAFAGGALTAFTKIIGVVNAVMQVASLITPWEVEFTVTPKQAFEVGYNGPGEVGSFFVKFVGVVGTPPPAVQSCLALFHVTDPTSLEGTNFRVTTQAVYDVGGVSPALLNTVDEMGFLDADNSFLMTFSTGSQTIENVENSKLIVDERPFIAVWDVHRIDVGHVAAWLRSAVDGESYQALLGPTLDEVATLIEFAANPTPPEVYIPVSYRAPLPKPEQQNPPPQQDPQTPGDEPPPGIGSCIEPAQVAAIFGIDVIEHHTEPAAPYPDTITGGVVQRASCVYGLDDGTDVGVVYPFTTEDPGGFYDGYFEPVPNCHAALFDFEGAPDLQSWTIWNTGNKTIASTYRYGVALPEGSDEWLAVQGSLISLAKVAGHCG